MEPTSKLRVRVRSSIEKQEAQSLTLTLLQSSRCNGHSRHGSACCFSTGQKAEIETTSIQGSLALINLTKFHQLTVIVIFSLFRIQCNCIEVLFLKKYSIPCKYIDFWSVWALHAIAWPAKFRWHYFQFLKTRRNSRCSVQSTKLHCNRNRQRR